MLWYIPYKRAVQHCHITKNLSHKMAAPFLVCHHMQELIIVYFHRKVKCGGLWLFKKLLMNHLVKFEQPNFFSNGFQIWLSNNDKHLGNHVAVFKVVFYSSLFLMWIQLREYTGELLTPRKPSWCIVIWFKP